jgi:triosephosphate isomerase
MKFSAALFLLSLTGTTDAFVNKQFGVRSSLLESSTTTTELFARKPFITGNWKLNPQSKSEAVDLARGIADSITGESPSDVALFVPFPYLETVQGIVGDKLIVGAEVSNQCNLPITAGNVLRR